MMQSSSSSLSISSSHHRLSSSSHHRHSHSHSHSVSKTLTHLMNKPGNRCCADCRCALVDSSQVFASFRPQNKISVYSDFKKAHRQFAPPGSMPTTLVKNQSLARSMSAKCTASAVGSPLNVLLEAVEGHGVFLCAQCGAAHKILGSSISVVHRVLDSSSWTYEEVVALSEAGGNNRCGEVYEAFIPDSWRRRRPSQSSSLSDRLAFCRAKYEAMAFILPPSGPLSNTAFQAMMRITERRFGYNPNQSSSSIFSQDIHAHTLGPAYSGNRSGRTMDGKTNHIHHEAQLPNRLIDYFCVVGSSGFLGKSHVGQDLSLVADPEEIEFEPKLIDCFPSQDSHSDMEFPEHIPTFVFPEGCRASKSQMPPSFHTMVLTCADGSRLYGGVLRLYDEPIDIETFGDLLQSSGYMGAIPRWVDNSKHFQSTFSGAGVGGTGSSSVSLDSGVVFIPKCLVILSHYGMLDLMRRILLQLYRITLVEAPLPIERFIANVTCEVPLPPPGRVEIRFGFTAENILSIRRPAENCLPMANFPFKPLFASLSVQNIMVAVGCLMEETSVTLVSRHYSILCPVAEALLSFLFPFQWRGLYVPVVPYSMKDILNAPVPFLVGLHSRYLYEKNKHEIPPGVVFVDLDNDIVHLGFDEDRQMPRRIPALPEKAASKLKMKLDEYGGSIYMAADTANRGIITSGEGVIIANVNREAYAQMTEKVRATDIEVQMRIDLLRSCDKAYQHNELQGTVSKFLSEHGHLYENKSTKQNSNLQATDSFISKFGKKSPLKRRNKKISSEKKVHHKLRSGKRNTALLDLEEPKGFSSEQVRKAFLRFFVTLFTRYERFLDDKNQQGFRSVDFIADLGLTADCQCFVSRLLSTQMFQCFIQEREINPHDPLFTLFDESIMAKQNRSKLNITGKKNTPFLDDKSQKITETYNPPPPSNWGLPDDGQTYQYGSFPKLQAELFGKTRKAMSWPEHTKHRSYYATKAQPNSNAQKWYFELTSKTNSCSVGAMLHLKLGVRTLEAAILALSSLNRNKLIKFDDPDNGDATITDDSISNRDITSSGVAASAEKFITDTRRIRGILLGMVIKIQAFMAAYRVRWRYRVLLRAVINFQYRQRRFLSCRSTLDETQAKRHSDPNRKKLMSKFIIATVTQKFCRGIRTRRLVRNLRVAVLHLQALFRGKQARIAFRLLKQMISTGIQARWRGILARKHMRTLLEGRLVKYRGQIFEFWKLSNTPLSYRTKFWPFVADKCGFLRLALAESELKRLWEEALISTFTAFGRKHPQLLDANVCVDDEIFALGQSLGVNNDVYYQMLQIEPSLRVHAQVAAVEKVSKKTKRGGVSKATMERRSSLQSAASDSRARLSFNSMTTGMEDFSHAPNNFADDSDRVEAERLQIYERLSAMTDENCVSFFDLFQISVKNKKKKVQLAEAAWQSLGTASSSVKLILELFPELEESTNINFMPPSKKGVKRFRSARYQPSRLREKMWAHCLLTNLINKDLREVAISCMRKEVSSSTSPPTISQTRYESNMQKQSYRPTIASLSDHRKIASTVGKGFQDKQVRRKLITNFLYGNFSKEKHISSSGHNTVYPKPIVMDKLSSDNHNGSPQHMGVEIISSDNYCGSPVVEAIHQNTSQFN